MLKYGREYGRLRRTTTVIKEPILAMMMESAHDFGVTMVMQLSILRWIINTDRSVMLLLTFNENIGFLGKHLILENILDGVCV